MGSERTGATYQKLQYGTISAGVPQELIDIIDSLAVASGITRSALVRQTLEELATRNGHNVEHLKARFIMTDSPVRRTQPIDEDALAKLAARIMGGGLRPKDKVCTECDGTIPSGSTRCPHCLSIC